MENFIKWAIVVYTEHVITPAIFPPNVKHIAPKKPAATITAEETGLTLEEIERLAIISALDKAGGNQTKAAKLLDIPRQVVIYRIKKLGV